MVAGLIGAVACRAETVTVKVGSAAIELTFQPDTFDLPKTAIIDWVRNCANAVAAYYGRFPVSKARIQLRAARGEYRVSRGRSFGNDGASSRISVGEHATEADLKEDWMLTHEMVHYGFPNVEDEHHWIEEGTATYVEPIARARVGALKPEQVWSDVVRDMPQGLPQAGDQGLNHTHTWGRTYWGGALFCLLADVGIRKQTGNRKGLEDALRAINAAGGTIDNDWPLSKALAAGDRATGGNVLAELYARMKDQPMAVDLDQIWAELGIRRGRDTVSFDSRARFASVRESIMAGRRV